MKFTKELRESIIRDFCQRRNSGYDPALFEQEVREAGPSHPAYEWFEWDEGTAAREHRIWQARKFVEGITITFKVEEVQRNGTLRVTEVTAPALLSPLDERSKGGGYYLTDPSNPAHLSELCRQAANDLRRWRERYALVLPHVGLPLASIDKIVARIDGARKVEKSAA